MGFEGALALALDASTCFENATASLLKDRKKTFVALARVILGITTALASISQNLFNNNPLNAIAIVNDWG